ncbi:MAG: NAD(P)H-hydrate epimerase [Candidatus Omnitrophica bacterium]|nr:NAD(P)H-hydrate epimerase [Candidatus Omnitrophota bacterium]
MKVVSAPQMRQIDKIAIENYGIPSIVLMENAGRAVAGEVFKMCDDKKGDIVTIFCGKGNNGGDGLVVARHLIMLGKKVVIWFLGDPKNLKKDAAINFKILSKMGQKINTLSRPNDLKRLRKRFKGDIIVDAIFGTGFSGSLPPLVTALTDFLNYKEKPIISIDVPSGLNATTGSAAPGTIAAAKTVTFGLAKKGFYIDEGPRYVGEVVIYNIGFPERLL